MPILITGRTSFLVTTWRAINPFTVTSGIRDGAGRPEEFSRICPRPARSGAYGAELERDLEI